jgi:hypothetical protein
MRFWTFSILALVLMPLAASAAKQHEIRLPARGAPYAKARAELLKQGLAIDCDLAPYPKPRHSEADCDQDRALFLETADGGWRYYVIVEVDPNGKTVSRAYYPASIDALPAIPPPLAPDVPQLKGSYLKARKRLLVQGFKPARYRDHSFMDRFCRDENCDHTFMLPEIQCSGTGLGYCNAYWISRGGRALHVSTIGDDREIYFVEWSNWKSLRSDGFRK